MSLVKRQKKQEEKFQSFVNSWVLGGVKGYEQLLPPQKNFIRSIYNRGITKEELRDLLTKHRLAEDLFESTMFLPAPTIDENAWELFIITKVHEDACGENVRILFCRSEGEGLQFRTPYGAGGPKQKEFLNLLGTPFVFLT
jgi:hypothetical protein